MATNTNDDKDVEIKITKLEGRIDHLEEKVDAFLQELRIELKTIKDNTSTLQTLSTDYAYQKESMARLFHRLEKMEDKFDIYDAFINQYEGAKKLAWILWTIMGSAITAIIIKVWVGG